MSINIDTNLTPFEMISQYEPSPELKDLGVEFFCPLESTLETILEPTNHKVALLIEQYEPTPTNVMSTAPGSSVMQPHVPQTSRQPQNVPQWPTTSRPLNNSPNLPAAHQAPASNSAVPQRAPKQPRQVNTLSKYKHVLIYNFHINICHDF